MDSKEFKPESNKIRQDYQFTLNSPNIYFKQQPSPMSQQQNNHIKRTVKTQSDQLCTNLAQTEFKQPAKYFRQTFKTGIRKTDNGDETISFLENKCNMVPQVNDKNSTVNEKTGTLNKAVYMKEDKENRKTIFDNDCMFD